MQIHNPLSQFLIFPLLKVKILGICFNITNFSLVCIIAMLVYISLFYYISSKENAQPKRAQMLFEISHSMISNMIEGTIGMKKGKPFVPIIFSLFMFIFLCNLIGMIPFGFALTSQLTTTFFFATIIFVIITITGVFMHGIKILKIFVPSGCPIWLLPLMILIELFSFLAKPISLALRLTANITAGHILLHIIASFTVCMWALCKVIPLGFMVVITGFELGVCVLQAYIFSILSCVYLNDVINLH